MYDFLQAAAQQLITQSHRLLYSMAITLAAPLPLSFMSTGVSQHVPMISQPSAHDPRGLLVRDHGSRNRVAILSPTFLDVHKKNLPVSIPQERPDELLKRGFLQDVMAEAQREYGPLSHTLQDPPRLPQDHGSIVVPSHLPSEHTQIQPSVQSQQPPSARHAQVPSLAPHNAAAPFGMRLLNEPNFALDGHFDPSPLAETTSGTKRKSPSSWTASASTAHDLEGELVMRPSKTAAAPSSSTAKTPQYLILEEQHQLGLNAGVTPLRKLAVQREYDRLLAVIKQKNPELPVMMRPKRSADKVGFTADDFKLFSGDSMARSKLRRRIQSRIGGTRLKHEQSWSAGQHDGEATAKQQARLNIDWAAREALNLLSGTSKVPPAQALAGYIKRLDALRAEASSAPVLGLIAQARRVAESALKDGMPGGYVE